MRKLQYILTLFLFATTFSITTLQAKEITNLKTEYTETPLGIDVEYPRFSWQMQSDKLASRQTAYQLIVSNESGRTVWNSGKVSSDVSLNIKYAGTTLEPCTRYQWHVTVWDEKNKKFTQESWFETGLMNSDPGLTAWDGARWLGGGDDDMVLYSPYLPVFRIDFFLRLDEASGSTKAGLIYGANDDRLMDKNKNLYKLENQENTSYLLVQLDIDSLKLGGPAQIHLYRVGYHHDDKENIPFKSIPVPASLISEQNKYDIHRISVSSVLGYTYIYVNGNDKQNLIAEFNANPLGTGGDFIAFPVVADIGLAVPENQTATFSRVEIRNYRSPANVIAEVKELNRQMEGGNTGQFITISPAKNSMPMLRTTFLANSGIAKARLYVTSRGIYEFFINGQRIGNDYFNPGLTQYNKTHLYQTYDVTEHINSGKNAIGVVLGEGWWSGGATYMGDFWNFFGDRQSLLAKLVITYKDGREDVVVTNPSTWTYYNDGPVVYSSFFQGEVYNALNEKQTEGWSTATYDDSSWKQSNEVTLDNHISLDERNRWFNMPMVDDYSGMNLIGQFGETVRQIKEITAVSVEEVRPGVFVYDMGQNMAGVPKISLNGMEPGKEIKLRYAEVKYPDLPEYEGNTGMIMLENIRAAMAQDIYITKGGNETIHPRFTFHGYRFLEITGISSPLPLDAVKGVVLSSIHQLASGYETSNALVNKLWENITWSTYANFFSIPTDCPQRNERLGWGGDISVYSRTATYLANVSQFLRRHLLAIRDVQREDGRFPDIAPLGGGFGGMLWGSSGITVAWESYQQYQDTDLLAEHYDAMKAYINYLLDKNFDPQTGILTQENPGAWGNLGDWLSPEDSKNDKTILWESYFIYDLELMAKMATVLGKQQDAERYKRLSDERKAFFNKTYVDPQTGKTIFSDFGDSKDASGHRRQIDSQVSYVLPFAFNLLNEQNKALALNNFIVTIKRENIADIGTVCPPYSLMTGFIGTAWISKALSDNGHTDIAYKLLQQTTYPSWLYSVEQGATTIWERLNSYTHVDGFGGNNRMNSFNHYSFGAIGAWMYNYSLGIDRDENHPGFKHFILKPEPDPTGKMTFAKGFYDSMYGRIESSWEIKDDGCMYRFVVPANTTAKLLLQSSAKDDVTENGKPLSTIKGVKYVGMENGKQTFLLSSGAYHLFVKK